MSKKFTGGPAFPQQVQVAADGTTWFEGMTLRDYFAAKAMRLQPWFDSEDNFQNHADRCYAKADAMLEARES
ncbi:MAG: hypothetical protein AN484_11920 [Aphanizomenon flos-aquae WA102]|uniref:Uncharacterized protein n=1 Tax=Aphanizomenon flos-aquae WA102 TaxID=1710896 RepID=A0A1B7X2J7_APHFL|nr:MAG: hypothetical protein AN484_11920 [Aphanizomenon flos-aquae WA102]